ncbi:hypothetical protein [Lutibacter sp.]|uniref:hypothetical protein n=1 Tax=Lutibacter sp. TaxID=1925666 RepID=UPI0025C4550E|nr:hypothetical protein [Lutibacter sp.]MCF6167105.1 hypothetical protein [Lutibacter sp.]
MNSTDFTRILQNPENIDTSKTMKLEEIISEFPYFQSARSLLLKGLNKTGSYKYNISLKKTAAYTVDREVLFNFITSPIFITKNTPKIKPLENIKVLHKKITDTVLSKNSNTKKETIEGTEILEIGKPIQFNSTEPHSFNEWMQLITQKTITREEKKATKSNIIDTFIKTNPKIKAIDKTAKNIDISPESSTANDSLMTETLAKVYLEQKKYENAIKAYHILSLKYPEKSGFFADRIKAIKNLQNNKS